MRRKKSIKKFCFTHVKDESYNEISRNPNKSLQSTETAGFEFARFNFRNQSITNPTQCCGNISAAET